MLLGDDSDSEVKITINKSYAERYNTWRQKEELQKLKDRYGDDALKNTHGFSGDSSSSEDEDENADQLTQQLEKDFFKTLSCLKKKDPCIYDNSTYFFDGSVPTHRLAKSVKKEKKPLFLRDYERKLIVEREGKLSEDEDEDNEIGRPASPTIVEEEKLIKDSLKSALKDSDEENGDNDDKAWGGIFKKRIKTKEEEEKEDEDYREWLRGQREELADKTTETDLKFLHDYWNDPRLDKNEQFLKDYILNKRFLEENNNDDDDDDEYIPTYEEIVHDSDENLSEDEKTIEKQEEFEHKFNFRFEEPDKEFIKRYPRTMENSLRKKDDRRKRKRQEVKERKIAEEGKKREELKRLKSLKRKEIMEKIDKLKEITGNEDVGFKDEDLEGDFDPEEYDKRMNQLFSQEFYGEIETSKPECPQLEEELEIENWNLWTGEDCERNSQDEFGQKEQEPHCEDPHFNMDCDYDPAKELQNELIQSTKRKKKGRKWKSVFAQAVSQKKPVFDSSSYTFDKYIDEYYKLDFEDLIGDLPCRFKYRKVVPNSFGLSIDEILKADDKELNKWCTLKKAVQHRPEHVEKYDLHAYQKKAKNEQLKKKILQSIYFEKPIEEQVNTENEKQKKKSKKDKHLPKEEETKSGITDSSKKKKEVDEAVDADCEQLVEDSDENTSKQLKRKHKRQKEVDDIGEFHSNKKIKLIENGDIEESNIESDNIVNEPKKKKNKQETNLVEKINGHHISGFSIIEEGKAIENNIELVREQKSIKEANHEFPLKNSQHNQHSSKQKKRKKKKNKNKKAENVLTPNLDSKGVPPKSNKRKIARTFSDKQKQKIHGKKSRADQNGLSISDARLRAYGINPKKYKNKLKYGNR